MNKFLPKEKIIIKESEDSLDNVIKRDTSWSCSIDGQWGNYLMVKVPWEVLQKSRPIFRFITLSTKYVF